jgi:hypothetical protein
MALRLSLSNNHLFHIPYRFAECSHLRYLNIRANNFREFPRGVRVIRGSAPWTIQVLTGILGVQTAAARDIGSQSQQDQPYS